MILFFHYKNKLKHPNHHWVKACLLPLLQDRDFLAKQKEDLELAMKRITADNRREICDKERECLTRKQELLRGGCQRAGGALLGQNLCEWTSHPVNGLLHPKMKHPS